MITQNDCRHGCPHQRATIITCLSLLSFLTIGLSSPPAKADLLQFQCVDYFKRPVLNVKNDTLKDVAFSDLLRYRGLSVGPMIIINTKRLEKLNKPSQLFFITHECGHHVLGHLYFRQSNSQAEQEADCYAIRTLIRRGGFTFKDIAMVQSDMRKFAKASFAHLGGEERAEALLKCIEY